MEERLCLHGNAELPMLSDPTKAKSHMGLRMHKPEEQAWVDEIGLASEVMSSLSWSSSH